MMGMASPPLNRPERKVSRLADYDYRQGGWYFVTVCSKDRAVIFGRVEDGAMKRNALGEITAAEWERTFVLRPYLVEDVFVVMPNHVHLLFGLLDDGEDTARRVPTADSSGSPRQFGRPVTRSVSSIIGAYKSAVTREVNRQWDRAGGTLWQARFHDRIVRDEREHEAIRQYILDNPLRWHLDPYRP